jgi:hypothetical protein
MTELTAHLAAQDAALFLLMCLGIIWLSIWHSVRSER